MPGPLGTGSGGGAGTITSVTGGTGISVSGTTALTVSSTGVTSIVAGTNVSVSGATGAVTVNAPAYGTTITASTIGGTAAAGTSTGVAREDHKHAFPSGAAPSALTVSSTQATGTSASPALADHVHAMPGSATAGASAVGDTAATGTATTVALSDHRHSREAFGTPGAVTGGATAASGSASTLARSDHVHSTASMPVLLASTTLASDTASVTWSSISQSFGTLKIEFAARSTRANVYDYLSFRLNGDTTSSYYTTSDAVDTKGSFVIITSSTNGLLSWSTGTAIFTRYASTGIKSLVGLGGTNTQGTTPYNILFNGLTTVWTGTAAVTSITLLPYYGPNLLSGSEFRLYGYP